ncbi:hypothetical protein NB689_003206 [Xanthomonas sacchari]|nr:hypothetical protein [Xanthomonas sacchari]
MLSSKYFQFIINWFSACTLARSLARKIAFSSSGQSLLPPRGKMVACSGITSPTFQPFFFASASPTAAPVRVSRKALSCSGGISYSLYTSKKFGATEKLGKKSLGSL